jgi:hypothetical protein
LKISLFFSLFSGKFRPSRGLTQLQPQRPARKDVGVAVSAPISAYFAAVISLFRRCYFAVSAAVIPLLLARQKPIKTSNHNRLKRGSQIFPEMESGSGHDL